ncbi:hypothetical protein A2223_01265 [Candidatus Falkowbacteria bacterium RIFOXYA2_FULL_35_8]|uniref:Uncharacterized protein n=1 Tax=Candidatus Falkowbacteria bacterium RIFOXYC2_FULL_36_12 TaxID=1798002 RepID=A0A1F5T032_9BACT|nr:MAG: hypothetical protein A2300_00885 [Candidatus Falkowbacteria bacterium RIFOXYB2_FULL_35_7]OGF32279.1 MAG: hypothetical protein A2478_03055 [Candidatus Falkowbacteria bacterium RIFOXYC2_FULL_36_12]OGF33856.1 MAG: hypothetical protein A2223_01265 [Candidatus Falkowbacteria bacterium RIFOXYA2_FULL_35_8]
MEGKTHFENLEPDVEEVIEDDEDILDDDEKKELKITPNSENRFEKQPEFQPEKEVKKNNKLWLFLGMAVLLSLIIIGLWFVFYNNENNKFEPNQNLAVDIVQEENVNQTKIEYFSFLDQDKFYSVKIPENWFLARIEQGFRLNESAENSNKLIEFQLVEYSDELDTYLTQIAEVGEFELAEKSRIISAGLQGRKVKFVKEDLNGYIVVLKKNNNVAVFYLNSEDEKYQDILTEISRSFVLFDEGNLKNEENQVFDLMVTYNKDFDVNENDLGFEIKYNDEKIGEIKAVSSEKTIGQYRDDIINSDNFKLIDEYSVSIDDRMFFVSLGSQFEIRKKLYLIKNEGSMWEIWLDNMNFEAGFEQMISTLKINN